MRAAFRAEAGGNVGPLSRSVVARIGQPNNRYNHAIRAGNAVTLVGKILRIKWSARGVLGLVGVQRAIRARRIRRRGGGDAGIACPRHKPNRAHAIKVRKRIGQPLRHRIRRSPEQITGADLPLFLRGGTDGKGEPSGGGSRFAVGLTGPLQRQKVPVALRRCLPLKLGQGQTRLNGADNTPETNLITIHL